MSKFFKIAVFVLASVVFLGFSGVVIAKEMDLVSEPVCFKVRNTAAYTVMGSFVTDYYPDPSGVQARHRSDFRLGAQGKKDRKGNYIDRAEFCTYGPFLPGRKLELVLRTIFPIFSCNTRIDQGEILIQGTAKPEGGYKTEARCF